MVLHRLEQMMIEVVEKVVPSVVSVTITKLAETQLSGVVPVKGQGSGVILTSEGHIVTNAHVVSGVQDVEVTIDDGRTYRAEIIGKSKVQDLAILKIDSGEFAPIEFAKSGGLKVGQFAIAVGHPLGLGATITFGVVSALERTISNRQAFLEGLIQTSAQINPGNSGGALVNTDGKLIGLPTAMIPWSQGIGFAIASDRIEDAFEEIIQTGTIATPWMGIMGATLNKGIATHYKLSVNQGALVLEVPQGPSRRAGLKSGDVITAIDDNEITGMQDLRAAIFKRSVGDNIDVVFYRGDEKQDVKVKLQSAP
ncbi:MAG: PDZ domain-containing protein [Candidatus Lokiarchaeota archaeon]|nr:PDZ domain-containing protein [Candidatus Lokiarchaeota archaeon]